ncbi:hypothetical protein TIN4_51 [Tsukamurella phage TIN4]|uniref:Uncharacterized protein n=2 Tax=Tinduovirus TIN3 TaxID=1982571 RepID=A0A0K0N6B1_9CAUD|nr:hypothetical protein AVT54_gp074 [Tsukamurella phage TIN3]YP_009604181.1 hypothetical protein FDH87_gp074 [Tsukamurella phage TIN4]AKJ71848.1 hypothetical protein TIN3_51 [Tsukamurella phage TIN3]AKJ71957.1 hypothetical protein TIN4_51 [Tsukamurella phage TIN4]
MKAEGCRFRNKRCQFPSDKHANLIPVSIEDTTFRFQIEWDNQYRNAPLETRERYVCRLCADIVNQELAHLELESKLIDKHYGKESRRERCT